MTAASVAPNAIGVTVQLPLFKKSLRAVERSHRLAERVQTYFAGLRLLSVSYEQVLRAR